MWRTEVTNDEVKNEEKIEMKDENKDKKSR